VREKPVRGRSLADFVCERLRLVVELVGAGHEGTVEYDLR
jgi:very-short-patch-repair endonuclease